jgi:thymidylate synthase (FAD)
MNVILMAHTQLTDSFLELVDSQFVGDGDVEATDGQAIALTAIRTCYSANKPSEIVAKEGAKYFGNKATDGAGGTEADRLFRHIIRSKHTSTLEHISFTFAIEGVSRSLLAQLTRHRAGFSFSVQSQRYVRFGSGDKSGGFDYAVPDTVAKDRDVQEAFREFMDMTQEFYDVLREAGVPAEDARAVLPNAAATNLVMTANLTALLSFYSKRRKGRGAQAEIADFAERLREEVVEVEPWTEQFFETV